MDKSSSFDECLNHFPSPTLRESLLRGPWWGTVFTTIIMGRNVDYLRPMSTSTITMNNSMNRTISNIATWKYTTPTWVIGCKLTFLISISTYNIIINTLCIIDKERVAGIFRPKYTSSIVTTSITSLVTMHNFMKRTRSSKVPWKSPTPT